MNLYGVGALLIAVGIVLALATTASEIGWLLCVGGVIVIVAAAIMAASHRRQ